MFAAYGWLRRLRLFSALTPLGLFRRRARRPRLLRALPIADRSLAVRSVGFVALATAGQRPLEHAVPQQLEHARRRRRAARVGYLSARNKS